MNTGLMGIAERHAGKLANTAQQRTVIHLEIRLLDCFYCITDMLKANCYFRRSQRHSTAYGCDYSSGLHLAPARFCRQHAQSL